ncbi:MAG: C2H2-type zinc finger protein [Candidatus Bathyarchaeia archaeon]
MEQTKLDIFIAHMCNECGQVFASEKSLKIHMAKHLREDHGLLMASLSHLTAGEVKTLLKAITSRTMGEAVKIMSGSNSAPLRNLAGIATRRPELFAFAVRMVAEELGVDADEDIDYIG